MMQSTKGYRRVIYPSWRYTCEMLWSSKVLLVWQGCDSPWVHSLIVWAECSSPWWRLTWAPNWSWSTFNFLSSSSWRCSISAMCAWSWRRTLFFIMVVWGRLEFSRSGSRQWLEHVLTMNAGGREGSFTTIPRWVSNVLTKFWSWLTLALMQ